MTPVLSARIHGEILAFSPAFPPVRQSSVVASLLRVSRFAHLASSSNVVAVHDAFEQSIAHWSIEVTSRGVGLGVPADDIRNGRDSTGATREHEVDETA